MTEERGSGGKRRPATEVAHLGRDPRQHLGAVNTPVYRATTILFDTVAELEAAERGEYPGITYGLHGLPTVTDLQAAMAALEGGYAALAVPSGLAAITLALLAVTRAGDHVLVTDSVYGPTRRFCDHQLTRFGVTVTYYDPLIGAGIEREIRPATKIVFVESPGSLSFEVQDVPAIAAAAHARGALVLIDNTWATPLYFKPFDHGCDLSIHAGTKYIVGHSDAMMGIISCATRQLFETAKTACQSFGFHAAPDDCYPALRGLRTMGVRLRHHEKSGVEMAHWLKDRPEVDKVLHPALPDCPGHDNWKKQFKGSSGLFSFTLRDGYSKNALAAMLDGMDIFGMGASWGGYESLLIPAHPDQYRTAVPWPKGKHLLRVHIGLEDVEDLKTDLVEGFDRLNRAHNA
jgi:cystathionine beta-lyase